MDFHVLVAKGEVLVKVPMGDLAAGTDGVVMRVLSAEGLRTLLSGYLVALTLGYNQMPWWWCYHHPTPKTHQMCLYDSLELPTALVDQRIKFLR